MTEQALMAADETAVITDDAITAAAKFDPRARELEAAKALWVEIELEVRRGKLEPGEDLTDDDIRTAQDSFDGATTLDSLIRRLMLEIIDHETVAPGIDAVVANLKARKERAAKQILWNRALIEKAMIMANWTTKEKSLKLDIGQVNCRPATAQIEVINEAELPAEFFKRADPTLDRAALKARVLGRHKALTAALAIRDQSERERAIAQVQADYGDELKGVEVKVDGYTTTIKFS